MKDFDQEFAGRVGADVGFKVLGETFQINAGVHPRVLIDFESAPVQNHEELVAACDKTIKAFLTSDDDRARWDTLCARTEEPVLSYGYRRAIVRYLYEAESELPTIAPASSSDGRETASPQSEDATSSPAEPES